MAFRDPTPEENIAVEQAQTAGRTFSDVPTGPPAPDPDTPWGEAIKESISNIKPSAIRFGKDIETAVTNPVQTIESLGNLVFGAIDAALPDPTTSPSLDDPDAPGQDRETLVTAREQRAEQGDLLIGHFKNRYGSVEGFKQAIAKDPVGVLADATFVLNPVGGGVKLVGTVGKVIGEASKAGKLARAGELLAKTGEVVQTAGRTADPIRLAGKAASGTFRLIPKPTPVGLFQRAAKFSTALPQDVRQRMIQLALDERLMPTINGVDKLRGQINEIAQRVTTLVDDATETGTKIRVARLFKEFTKLEKDAKLSGLPATQLKQLNRVRQQISAANKKSLSVADAQTLKQNIYADLQKTYNSVTEQPAAVKAQQSVARAAKEAIEGLIPEIKQLNARQGARLELVQSLERAANRISNNDVAGLRLTSPATAGGVAGGGAGLAAGAAVGVLEFPRVKSALAIALNDIQKVVPGFTPPPLLVELGIVGAEAVALQERVERTAVEGK